MGVEKQTSFLWPTLLKAWRGRDKVLAELAEMYEPKYETWGVILYRYRASERFL